MKIWFCLNFDDGEIYCLGKFSNFEQADIQANIIGLSPVWLIDEETAKQWKTKLEII
jgi:hypothetical protein